MIDTPHRYVIFQRVLIAANVKKVGWFSG